MMMTPRAHDPTSAAAAGVGAGGPQEEAAGNAPRVLGAKEVAVNSVLLAINGYPVTSLTHDEKMRRLKVGTTGRQASPALEAG